jgi:hypothetical protein
MKLPKLTVRRLMFHVAFLAIVTEFLQQIGLPWAVPLIGRRSAEFHDLWQYHSGRDWMSEAWSRNRSRAVWNSPPVLKYHAEMAEKYKWAA